MRAHTLRQGDQAMAIDCTPSRVVIDLGWHVYQPEWCPDEELQANSKPGIPEFYASGTGYVVFDKPADADISVFVE